MDPESKQLLQATFNLAEENSKMLHKIRNVQKRATLWQVLKIVVIIGITLGAFYYVEPYMAKVMELYGAIFGTGQAVGNTATDPSLLQNLLKTL